MRRDDLTDEEILRGGQGHTVEDLWASATVAGWCAVAFGLLLAAVLIYEALR